MRNTITITFALLVIFSPNMSFSNPNLNFQDLVTKALENNFNIKERQNNITSKNFNLWLSTRDLYIPKMTFQLLAFDEDIYNGPLSDSEDYTSDNNRTDLFRNPLSYKSRLGLSYNFFNGFKDYYRNEENKIVLEKSKVEYQKTVEDLIYKLKDTYLDFSLEASRLNIIQEELERDTKILNAARLKYKKGVIAKSDLSRAQIQHLNTLDDLKQQRKKIKNLEIEIIKLIGIDSNLERKIEPIDYMIFDNNFISIIDQIKKNGALQSANEFYRIFERQGSNLKILKFNSSQQEAVKNQAWGDYLPKLSLQLYHNYTFYDQLSKFNNTKHDSLSVGITLTIPLFDSFDTMISNKQEKLALINTQYQIKQKRQQTKNTLKQLCINLINEYQSYQTTKQKFELRKYVYTMTAKQFATGAVTTKDLIDDKVYLQIEKFNLAEKSHQLRKIYLQIEKIMGILKKYGSRS